MRFLLVGLAFLLLLSFVVVACKDNDCDRLDELEQRMEALEHELGISGPWDEDDWDEDYWDEDDWDGDDRERRREQQEHRGPR